MERDLLQKEVIPVVARFCDARGWSFDAVDLRWGITAEASLNQKTMQICLKELEVCQKVSPKPNFLVMLGDRYGWIPIPEKIDEPHMRILRTNSNEYISTLLDNWYILDNNCIPSSYVLCSREGRFIDQQTYFEEVERPLVNFLSQVVALYPEDTYFQEMVTSATGQEVIHGALSPNTNAKQHVIFYDRVTCQAKKDVNYDKLKWLRDELTKQVDVSRYIDAETLRYGTNDYARNFIVKMIEVLKKVTEEEMLLHAFSSPLDEEQFALTEIIKEETDNFVGRELERQELWALIEGGSTTLIEGESGIGKTALMCRLISDAKDKGYHVFQVLCGAIPYTFHANNVIRLLLLQMGVEIYENVSLTLQLAKAIGKLNDNANILIFIDSIDIVESWFRTLTWLPSPLGSNVKVVISSLPDENLRNMIDSQYSLPRLDPGAKLTLLRSILKKVNRNFSDGQQNLMDALVRGEATPLYVTLFAAMVKELSSDIDFQREIINPSVEIIFPILLDLLGETGLHSTKFMRLAIEGLTLTKYGMAECEIVRWAAYDAEYMNELEQNSFHEIPCVPGTRKDIPRIIWSRLYHDLELLLVRKSMGNCSLLNWKHIRIDNAASQWILMSGEEARDDTERRLAKFFYDEMMFLDSVHALYELPYLQESSKKLISLLFDFEYLARRIKHDLTKELWQTKFCIFGEHPKMLDELARFEINAYTIAKNKHVTDIDEIKHLLFSLASSYRADTLIWKKLREYYPDYCRELIPDMLGLNDSFCRPLVISVQGLVRISAIDDDARTGLGVYKGRVYNVDLATGCETEIQYKNLPPVERIVVSGPEMRFLLMVCKYGEGYQLVAHDRKRNKIILNKYISDSILVDRVFISENPDRFRVALQIEDSDKCSYMVVSGDNEGRWSIKCEDYEYWLTGISGDGRYVYFQFKEQKDGWLEEKQNGFVRYDIDGVEESMKLTLKNYARHDCRGMAISYDGNKVVFNSDHFAVSANVASRSYGSARIHQHRMDDNHSYYRLSSDAETFVSTTGDGAIVVVETSSVKILYRVKTGSWFHPTCNIVNYIGDKVYAIPYALFGFAKNNSFVHSYIWHLGNQKNYNYLASSISDIDAFEDTIAFTPYDDELENYDFSIYVVNTADGTHSVILLPRMEKGYRLPSKVAITGRQGEFICCIAEPYIMLFRDGELYDYFEVQASKSKGIARLHDMDGLVILLQEENSLHVIIYDIYEKRVRKEKNIATQIKVLHWHWGERIFCISDDIICVDISEELYNLIISKGELVKAQSYSLIAIVEKAYPEAKVIPHCWKFQIYYVVEKGRITVVEVTTKGEITEIGFHDFFEPKTVPIFYHFYNGLAWVSEGCIHAIRQ